MQKPLEEEQKQQPTNCFYGNQRGKLAKYTRGKLPLLIPSLPSLPCIDGFLG